MHTIILLLSVFVCSVHYGKGHLLSVQFCKVLNTCIEIDTTKGARVNRVGIIRKLPFSWLPTIASKARVRETCAACNNRADRPRAISATSEASSLPSSFRLGDGRSIPAIGLGTFKIPKKEIEAAALAALTLGYRHIDTAEGYRNQAGVGRAIRKAIAQGILESRDDVFVTTKVWPGAQVWKQRVKSHEDVLQACRVSLQQLELDYVDLYLIHVPLSGSEARMQQWRALLELKQQGLVKSIGVSNYGIKHLKEIADAGLEMPCANQLELHPLCKQPDLLMYMEKLGVTPIAYSSLAPMATWRADYASSVGSRPLNDKRGSLLGEGEIIAMAKKLSVPVAKLLLRYGLQKNWPVLPKTTKPERLSENFGLSDFEIPNPDMNELDNLPQSHPLAYGRPGLPFDPTQCP